MKSQAHHILLGILQTIDGSATRKQGEHAKKKTGCRFCVIPELMTPVDSYFVFFGGGLVAKASGTELDLLLLQKGDGEGQ